MRETTAQIAAFCTEQGLGTMRVGRGSAAPPQSAQQQGQSVAGDTPQRAVVGYRRVGGIPLGGDTIGTGGWPGTLEHIYIYIHTHTHTHIHTYIHTDIYVSVNVGLFGVCD